MLISTASQGVNDKHSTKNGKSHREAANQNVALVSQRDTLWIVNSFENPAIQYEVKYTVFMCPFSPCYQACDDGGVCWHRYMCSCIASTKANHRSYSCKHAHLVKIKLNSQQRIWRPWECGNSLPTILPNSTSSAISLTSPAFGIGPVVLPGRSNTPQMKQRRFSSVKMHRTSKQKGRKPNKSPWVEQSEMLNVKQHLLRNLPGPSADINEIIEAVNLDELIG